MSSSPGMAGSARRCRTGWRRRRFSWVAIDSDPNNVNRARRKGLPVYYGDAGRIEVMEALGLADAKAMVIAINDAEKAVHLVALVHYVLPEMVILSRAFDDEHAMGNRGTPAPT